MEKTSIQNVTSLPIFSINHLYYNTNYCNKYVKLFQNELLKNVQKENDYNRFYIFNKDTLNETRNFLIK